MFLDNIWRKLSHSLEETEHDLLSAEERAEEKRKQRVLDLLIASSGSAEAVARITKSVYGKSLDKLDAYWQDLYRDALKSDAAKMSIAQKRKAASELPGFSLDNHEHEKLLVGLGFSLDDTKHTVADLKQLLGSLSAKS